VARRKIKEEIKKPDFLQVSLERTTTWVKDHTRTCIIAAAVALILILSGWGYAAYRAGRDDRAQDRLSDGIRSFQEYMVNPGGNGLSRAEASFTRVAAESSGGLGDVARLYLARIALAKGAKDQARDIYTKLAKHPSNDVVKKLAESGLLELNKK